MSKPRNKSTKQENTPHSYLVKITLLHTQPRVWRRVLVEPFTTLGDFHEIIQAIMPWEDYHPHQFIIGNNVFGDPIMDEMDGETLEEYAVDFETLYLNKKKRFVYEYDFGDGWEHEIKIEKRLALKEPLLLPLCLEGEFACPPEDSGGPFGYAEKIEILNNPKHEDHRDIREWMGDFDFRGFSLESTNARLQWAMFELPAEQLLERFQWTCGWCGSEITENQEVFVQAIHFSEDFDFKAYQGQVVPVTLSSRLDPLLCLIPKDDSPVRQKGKEGVFCLCRKKCATELRAALQRDLSREVGGNVL